MAALRHFASPLLVVALFTLAGCENEHPANIPGNAMLTTEGSGMISATAPQNGTAYVYDVNADRLVYSGAIAKGQVVTVDTKQNTVLVDSQVKTDRTLNQWNKHRIYFDDAPIIAKHVITEETRVAP